MKNKLKYILCLLLSLMMMLGMVLKTNETVFADDGYRYSDYVNTTTVFLFNGKPWYIIADNSTSATEGTLTLLAADTSFGLSRFSEDFDEDYSHSDIKGLLDSLVEPGGSFEDVSDAIVTNEDVGSKLYLLSVDEVKQLPKEVRMINFTGGFTYYNEWWLRTPNTISTAFTAYGYGGPLVTQSFSVYCEMGVRPALQLDLSTVTFSPESKEFKLKSNHTHKFNYDANGSSITATCEDGCPDDYDTTGICISLHAPTNLTYDGTSKEASISGYPTNAPDELAEKPTTITYYKSTGEGSMTVSGNALDCSPSNVGDYIAKMTWGNQTASVTFSITPGIISSSADDVLVDYDETAHGIRVNVNTPKSGYTIKYGETAENCSLDSSPTIKNVTDSPKTVYYMVSAPNYCDTLGSAKIIINKANQTSPDAPIKDSVTGTDVTLVEVEKCEYKMNEGVWQESPTFTGLEAGQTYTFYQRLKGDYNHNPSNSSSGTVISTLNSISAKVTFKVKNGSWDDGTTSEKTVTLTGYEGDTLKLSEDQIPSVGTNPAATYMTGSWKTVTPDISTPITTDTTFTYTYYKKSIVTHTVTFKVEKGSWDDGTTSEKTVTLTGYEGDIFKLSEDQIPKVGTKPADSYIAGDWDIIPIVGAEVSGKTTYTYTYAKKEDNKTNNKITYTNTSGKGSVWNLGSTGTLTFIFSRSENDAETINHFIGAKVDGKELGQNDFSIKSGSVVIDLKTQYLNALPLGEHTLTVFFDDGNEVTVSFMVKAQSEYNKDSDENEGKKIETKRTDNVVSTVDNVNISFYILVMILSFVLIVWIKIQYGRGTSNE